MFNIRPVWRKPKVEQVTPTEPAVPKNNWFRVGDTIRIVSFTPLNNYDISRNFEKFLEVSLKYNLTPQEAWLGNLDYFYKTMAPLGKFLTVKEELPNRTWVKNIFGTTRVYIVTDGMQNFWVSADKAKISNDIKCREIWT